MDHVHVPVLLEEALNGLAIKPDGIYIDATFGRGGHSQAILDVLSDQGKLMVIDKDPYAIEAAKALNDPRLIIRHGSFAQLDHFIMELGWIGNVNGVLMDLGLSSPQLDQAERGFSFMRDGILDMRMNPNDGLSAKEWLAEVEAYELADVIWRLGEERQARRIAKAIVQAREIAPIETTTQLAEIIEKIVHRRPGVRKHPATKTFQAIRIYINQELADLEQGLKAAVDVLAPGGRLAVISFHSLEDRMVKRFMQRLSTAEHMPRYLPVKDHELPRELKMFPGPFKASEGEIDMNVRSRSARLRIAEKR